MILVSNAPNTIRGVAVLGFDHTATSGSWIRQKQWRSVQGAKFTRVYYFVICQLESDSLFQVNPHSNYAYFILIHQGNAWDRLADILLPELRKGNISPQMYGAIYEYSSGRVADKLPIRYIALRPCQSRGCEQKLRLPDRVKINENRWAIGLGTLEVMRQKFELTRKYYAWKQRGAAENLPYFDFKCDLIFFQD